MAKKKKLLSGQERATETIRRLRDFYAAGKKANEAELGYGKKVSATQAVASGYSKSRLDHARKFAKLIPEEELKRICELRDSQGRAFGVGPITLLLPIAKPKDRWKLLEGWKKNAWSTRHLKQAIRRIREKSSHGGRPPSVPTGPEEVIAELSQMTQRWVGWCHPLLENQGTRSPSTDQLPAPVLDKVRTILKNMRKLQASLQELRTSAPGTKPKKRGQ